MELINFFNERTFNNFKIIYDLDLSIMLSQKLISNKIIDNIDNNYQINNRSVKLLFYFWDTYLDFENEFISCMLYIYVKNYDQFLTLINNLQINKKSVKLMLLFLELKDTKLFKLIVEKFANQLKKDKSSMENSEDFYFNLSCLSLFLPSEKSYYNREFGLSYSIASKLNCNIAKYRKQYISPLRKMIISDPYKLLMVKQTIEHDIKLCFTDGKLCFQNNYESTLISKFEHILSIPYLKDDFNIDLDIENFILSIQYIILKCEIYNTKKHTNGYNLLLSSKNYPQLVNEIEKDYDVKITHYWNMKSKKDNIYIINDITIIEGCSVQLVSYILSTVLDITLENFINYLIR